MPELEIVAQHLPDLALPDGHPLAGCEAWQCLTCMGIFYPDAVMPRLSSCPYCMVDEIDDNDA